MALAVSEMVVTGVIQQMLFGGTSLPRAQHSLASRMDRSGPKGDFFKTVKSHFYPVCSIWHAIKPLQSHTSIPQLIFSTTIYPARISF